MDTHRETNDISKDQSNSIKTPPNPIIIQRRDWETQERRMDMSENEKAAAMKLAEAFDALPEAKKERLLGYAEGVADMKAQKEEPKTERI